MQAAHIREFVECNRPKDNRTEADFLHFVCLLNLFIDSIVYINVTAIEHRLISKVIDLCKAIAQIMVEGKTIYLSGIFSNHGLR